MSMPTSPIEGRPLPSGLPAAAPEPFQPVAGPSRMRRTASDSRPARPRRTASDEEMRYTRADQHWLSEDEGVGQVESFLAGRQRRATHRRSDDPRDDDDDPGGDGKIDGRPPGKASLPAIIANGHTHRVHNRPSRAAPQSTTPPTDLPSAAALLSFMLTALACPSCHDTFANPTTLACGHTVCQGCMTGKVELPSAPPPVKGVDPSTPPLPSIERSPSISSTTSSTRRRRSPVIAAAGLLPEWLGGRRRGSTASEASTTEAPPTAGIFGRGIASSNSHSSDLAAPPRPKCPHPECRELATAGPTPRPDVVLQKIVARFVAKAPHKAPLRERMQLLRTDDDELAAHLVSIPTPGRTSREDSSGSGDSYESGSRTGSSGTMELTTDGKRPRKAPRVAAKRARIPEEAVMLIAEDDEQADVEDAHDGDAGDRGLATSPPLVPTFAELILEELECQVCTSIFNDPITTPCGHSFCRRCLIRSLDHSDRCPLCRSDMPSYSFFAHHAFNAVLTSFLEHADAFQEASHQRKALLAAEDHVGSAHVAVFVCSLSWPGLPTFLHVFEPRYRLMMRRAMSTDRRFGMALPPLPGSSFFEYGTMLEIRKLDMLPDGRSVVETVGLFRFRVLESGTLDGYSTAMVERIEDITAEQETNLERTELEQLRSATTEPPAGATAEATLKWQIERKSTEELMTDCRSFYEGLKEGFLTSWQYQRVNNTYGPMPSDPAEASFWFAQVLPIDDYQKAQLLPVTSPRLRLQLVVFWIEQLRAKWWYGNSGACAIM